MHALVADPLDQPVQHVDGGPRVVERAVGRRGARAEQPGQRGQPHAGRLVAGEHPPRQPDGAQHRRARPGDLAALRGGAQEADVEAGVVGDQHRAAGELQERRQHRVDLGASHTMAVVIPVSWTICGGMLRPGSTSVANSPSTTPPRTLTAPISVMASKFSPSPVARPPVVSRSTTTKVVSRSDTSPRSTSAKLSWPMR